MKEHHQMKAYILAAHQMAAEIQTALTKGPKA